MNCDDTLPRLADFADGLLPPAGAAAVDEHLASCAACAERARDLDAVRDVLYRPDEIGPPPEDLPERILTAARRRRRAPAMLRYAAAFLAGVAVTLALSSTRAASTAPRPGPASEPARIETSPEPETDEPAPTRAARVPRRIR